MNAGSCKVRTGESPGDGKDAAGRRRPCGGDRWPRADNNDPVGTGARSRLPEDYGRYGPLPDTACEQALIPRFRLRSMREPQ